MGKIRKIKVAVDLTPLRPGGENGGAKTLVLTLLRLFSSFQADDFSYLLIAEDWNFVELQSFQGPNITCLLKSEIYVTIPPVQPLSKVSIDNMSALGTLKQALLPIKKVAEFSTHFSRFFIGKGWSLVARAMVRMKRRLTSYPRLFKLSKKVVGNLRFQPKPILSVLQEKYGVDLLFCPFSAPLLAESGLPLVAIVYDLQHLDYPFFFTPEECFHRTQFLNKLLKESDKIICISTFTRDSFLNHFDVDREKLLPISICIHERLRSLDQDTVIKALKKLGLGKDQYFFFPANFWPHKNHHVLLAAYSIYYSQHLDSALDLVFTGALEESQLELKSVVSSLGLDHKVHFLGFLEENELIALWQGCKGLVFPSLYEGFGIPVLEALWFDKPVACSSVGSLPEVGGDAVIYFDPRKPEAIAYALAQLADSDTLVESLREAGRKHLRNFDQYAMAERYLSVFKDVVKTAP